VENRRALVDSSFTSFSEITTDGMSTPWDSIFRNSILAAARPISAAGTSKCVMLGMRSVTAFV
jgi:hypothetical protein